MYKPFPVIGSFSQPETSTEFHSLSYPAGWHVHGGTLDVRFSDYLCCRWMGISLKNLTNHFWALHLRLAKVIHSNHAFGFPYSIEY